MFYWIHLLLKVCVLSFSCCNVTFTCVEISYNYLLYSQFYVVAKLRLAFSFVSLTLWLLIGFFWWWFHFEWIVVIRFNWNKSYLHCQLSGNGNLKISTQFEGLGLTTCNLGSLIKKWLYGVLYLENFGGVLTMWMCLWCTIPW